VAFRRLKIEHFSRLAQGEVGLSHFEGRSYVGRMRPRILGQTVRLFVAEQAQRPASASPVESTRSGQPGPRSSGQRWSQAASHPGADHHRCDVWVRHAGKHVRPWLTCWEDVRSRKIVGWAVQAGPVRAG
jgi:hypothetical protein